MGFADPQRGVREPHVTIGNKVTTGVKGCFSRRSSKEDYGPEKQRRGWKLVFQTFDTTLVSPKVRHVLFPVYLRSSRWKVLLPRPAREQAKSSCSYLLIHVLHVRPFLCKRSAFCRFRESAYSPRVDVHTSESPGQPLTHELARDAWHASFQMYCSALHFMGRFFIDQRPLILGCSPPACRTGRR